MKQAITDKTNLKVELYICGECINFEEVTIQLEINPTETIQKSQIKVKEFALDYWCYGTYYEKSDNIDNQLRQIYNLFSNKANEVSDILKKNNASCGINIIINIYDDEFPQIVLERDIIKFAESINAEIGFDFYYM